MRGFGFGEKSEDDGACAPRLPLQFSGMTEKEKEDKKKALWRMPSTHSEQRPFLRNALGRFLENADHSAGDRRSSD